MEHAISESRLVDEGIEEALMDLSGIPQSSLSLVNSPKLSPANIEKLTLLEIITVREKATL